MYTVTGLTFQELAETLAFTKIRGPIGSKREDAYALMQVMASFAAQQGKAFNARDYLYWLPEPEPDEDDEPYDPDEDE
jgi:hypothetical protein